MKHSQVEENMVLLIGNGPTTMAALRSLTAHFRVCGMVRKPVVSGRDSVRVFAERKGVPVFSSDRIDEIAAITAQLRPDIVVISSFDRILKSEILALSRFVNVHYAPLPHYRGRANVNWALINGESTASISIHAVAPGLDSGNLYYQEEISIEPTDTATSLYERLNTIQERVLATVVRRVLKGDCGQPQNHEEATYGCARVPDDGEIDWNSSTLEIDRLIRALVPPFFPGAFTYVEGRSMVISRATPLSDAPIYEGRVPGRVIGRSNADGWVDLLTGDGVLRLLEVIPQVGQPCLPARLIKSTRATLGLSKRELLHRIHVLETRLTVLEAIPSSLTKVRKVDT